jgi:hypothetical protein
MSYSSILEAGTGFEPVMLRAYETAVVTTLPAVRARRVRTPAVFFKLNLWCLRHVDHRSQLESYQRDALAILLQLASQSQIHLKRWTDSFRIQTLG